MRQVPQAHYLLIGNGRVARHFLHYFHSLKLSVDSWCRQQSTADLSLKLKTATHILLLISDRAVDDFVDQHLVDTQAYKIHFSGSLLSEKAYGLHPLMSFNQELYELEHYQSIPFVMDDDAPDFAELLPGIPNQHARLNKTLKAKYHALCVLSSNFSCMLWQKFIQDLSHFNLPLEFANPILSQCTRNLLQDPKTALTGPLVRNDLDTISANLAALEGDAFQEIYLSFVRAYQRRL